MAKTGPGYWPALFIGTESGSTKIKVMRQIGGSPREEWQGALLYMSASGVSRLERGLLVYVSGLWTSQDNPRASFGICFRKARSLGNPLDCCPGNRTVSLWFTTPSQFCWISVPGRTWKLLCKRRHSTSHLTSSSTWQRYFLLLACLWVNKQSNKWFLEQLKMSLENLM